MPVKNTNYDLHNALFAQLEALQDESITGDELVERIKRATAIEGIADKILENQNVQIKAVKLAIDYGINTSKKVQLLGFAEDEI